MTSLATASFIVALLAVSLEILLPGPTDSRDQRERTKARDEAAMAQYKRH